MAIPLSRQNFGVLRSHAHWLQAEERGPSVQPLNSMSTSAVSDVLESASIGFHKDIRAYGVVLGSDGAAKVRYFLS
jgi:hypothetical protein